MNNKERATRIAELGIAGAHAAFGIQGGIVAENLKLGLITYVERQLEIGLENDPRMKALKSFLGPLSYNWYIMRSIGLLALENLSKGIIASTQDEEKKNIGSTANTERTGRLIASPDLSVDDVIASYYSNLASVKTQFAGCFQPNETLAIALSWSNRHSLFVTNRRIFLHREGISLSPDEDIHVFENDEQLVESIDVPEYNTSDLEERRAEWIVRFPTDDAFDWSVDGPTEIWITNKRIVGYYYTSESQQEGSISLLPNETLLNAFVVGGLSGVFLVTNRRVVHWCRDFKEAQIRSFDLREAHLSIEHGAKRWWWPLKSFSVRICDNFNEHIVTHRAIDVSVAATSFESGLRRARVETNAYEPYDLHFETALREIDDLRSRLRKTIDLSNIVRDIYVRIFSKYIPPPDTKFKPWDVPGLCLALETEYSLRIPVEKWVKAGASSRSLLYTVAKAAANQTLHREHATSGALNWSESVRDAWLQCLDREWHRYVLELVDLRQQYRGKELEYLIKAGALSTEFSDIVDVELLRSLRVTLKINTHEIN